MSAAALWLSPRVADAPERLRTHMLAALAGRTDAGDVATQLADAARVCMTRALHGDDAFETALELLAADALLTHACEAAAETGSGALAEFAAAWSPEHFEQLLPSPRK